MSQTSLASNPEFKRNLWLTFSRHRFYAMPALLILIFLSVLLYERYKLHESNLYQYATALFIFIVWLWGSRNANSSIVDELRDKTWDQQRMSALSPWAMTWGKLFGATAFNWYGGIICLAVMGLAGYAEGKPFMTALPTLIACGILMHASLIAGNLHASQVESRIIQRGGFGWLVIVLGIIIFPQVIFDPYNHDHVVWWAIPVSREAFLLYSALLFAACAVFGAWRVMCGALQVRTWPWAWPLFACILAAYLAGLNPNADAHAFLLAALLIAAAMTYIALFSEQTGILVWRRLYLRQQAGDFRGWLENLPMWPTSLLLTFVLALLSTILPSNTNLDIPSLSYTSPFTLALMVLRDACIVLIFTFSRNAKRALGAAVLYLAVIDFLLPFLAESAGLHKLALFFMPIGTNLAWWKGLLIMGSHTAIAISVVRWRLTQMKQG